MEQNNEEPGIRYSVVAMETTEKLQRICSNVVGYCRTVMNSTGKVFNSLDCSLVIIYCALGKHLNSEVQTITKNYIFGFNHNCNDN